MRVQLALNVKNLDEAVAYYSRLFDTEVNKRKPGYANFAIASDLPGNPREMHETTTTTTMYYLSQLYKVKPRVA